MTDGAGAVEGTGGDNGRPVVAVYPRHWLGATMTFVYRQTLAARRRFSPIVLCTSTENADRFPFEPVFERRLTSLDRHYSRTARALLFRSTHPSPWQVRHWIRILSEKGARLVHAHFGPSGLDMLPVARSLGIPLVVTFHGYDVSKLLRSPRYVRDLRRLFAYAHLVAVSRPFADRLVALGADPARTEVHHVGAPLARFRPVPREAIGARAARGEAIRFLQVSSFMEKKGHRHTVRAFRRFLDRDHDGLLTLAGDGPERPAVMELCRDLGISGRVAFPGPLDTEGVVRALAAADVFVHHSVTASDGSEEGVVTAIVEAMASGLPVLASRHGGIPELVRDGVDGYLVDEGDVEAYADRMERVLEWRPGDTQRWLEERFDLDRNMDGIMDLYDRLLGRSPRP